MLNTKLKHIALEYQDKKNADIFFIDILGLKNIKNFSVSADLSYDIFGIKKELEAFVYGNESVNFEIFITDKTNNTKSYYHVCIGVDDKKEFIRKCEKNNLKPFFVKKGDRKILFVKDFSNNLYEIKDN